MFNSKLYNNKYHQTDLSKYKFLVTGGAGFIGSNIVEYLLKYGAGHVRVLDNLSNGYFENIKDFMGLSNFEFIEGDIRSFETCQKAVDGIHYISHQAALGSVPRSIKDPIATNEVNISGFLNMLVAAKDSKDLIRFIYAASSSTYGDSKELPKVEGREGKPLSPYGLTKYVNEVYADVFSNVYGFNTLGLRYFNVFGPKQSPDNPYAAVIPIFCKAAITGEVPTINGDGENSRDFTFVENAVQANILGFELETLNKSEVCNLACGDQITLNEMWRQIAELSGTSVKPKYGPEREGDIRHSMASIEKIKSLLGYNPTFKFSEGLKLVFEEYQKQFGN